MASGLMADPPLKSALGLSVDQARVVDAIQARYRPIFAAKRTEHNNELRKLRRARIANDSKQIAELTKVTDALQAELKQIRLNEDEEIRRTLTPEQKVKFAEHIEFRKQMKGSSRDDTDFYK